MTHELYRTPALHTAGYTYDEIRRLLAAGGLARVRRGTYLAGDWPEDRSERHRLLVRASAGEFASSAVISYISAAVLHGLPTWGVPLDRVHVTRNRLGGGRHSARVHVHLASLRPIDVTTADGVAVTSVARTVVDVARSTGFERGVVVADAALAAGLADPGALAEAVAQVTGRRGAPLARRVVDFADARSESVGESRARVAIAQAGLPAPVPQWEVYDEDGWLVGRVDFGWPDRGVVGEFDGKSKYGRLVRPGETAADAVYREKRREDALRAHVRSVVRWGWDELDDFEPTARRLRRALS